MKVTLEKTDGVWDIKINFPDLKDTHDKMVAATEALSFVQSHGDLTFHVIEEITEVYGSEIATSALSVLKKAVEMANGNVDHMDEKAVAEMPVVDGVFLDIK